MEVYSSLVLEGPIDLNLGELQVAVMPPHDKMKSIESLETAAGGIDRYEIELKKIWVAF